LCFLTASISFHHVTDNHDTNAWSFFCSVLYHLSDLFLGDLYFFATADHGHLLNIYYLLHSRGGCWEPALGRDLGVRAGGATAAAITAEDTLLWTAMKTYKKNMGKTKGVLV
jgi:hypothetical protein